MIRSSNKNLFTNIRYVIILNIIVQSYIYDYIDYNHVLLGLIQAGSIYVIFSGK